MKVSLLAFVILLCSANLSAQITTGCPGCPSPKKDGGAKAEQSKEFQKLQLLLSKAKIKSLEELRLKISKEVKEQAEICTKYRGYRAKKITGLYHVLLVSYHDSIRPGLQPRGECNDCDQACNLMTSEIRNDLKQMLEDPYFKSYLLEYYSTQESEIEILIQDFKKFTTHESN
jgi:hypothetical protein